MTGLLLKYIFIFLWTSVVYLVLRRELVIKRKFRFSFVILPLYIVLIVTEISFSIIDFKEYNSFNNIQATQVTGIKVSQKIVSENDFNNLMTELKHDEFTWVNHPNVTQKDTLTVFTKDREYLFLIENTSNQGVLVSRINRNGNEYITNKNNYLLQYIE